MPRAMTDNHKSSLMNPINLSSRVYLYNKNDITAFNFLFLTILAEAVTFDLQKNIIKAQRQQKKPTILF